MQDFDSEFKSLKIYLHGFEADNYKINGKSVNYSTEDIRLIEPVTEFDPLPQREKRNYKIEGLKVLESQLTDEEIMITWN